MISIVHLDIDLILLFFWKCKGKLCAVFVVRSGDRPAVGPDDRFADGQADPDPLMAVRSG